MSNPKFRIYIDVELEGDVSVYAFSINRLDSQDEEPAAPPSGLPSPEVLRQWSKDPDNEMCWGLDRLADLLDSRAKAAAGKTP